MKNKRGKKGDKDVHMVVKIENKKENMWRSYYRVL
jgi:hypothetical protein